MTEKLHKQLAYILQPGGDPHGVLSTKLAEIDKLELPELSKEILKASVQNGAFLANVHHALHTIQKELKDRDI